MSTTPTKPLAMEYPFSHSFDVRCPFDVTYPLLFHLTFGATQNISTLSVKMIHIASKHCSHWPNTFITFPSSYKSFTRWENTQIKCIMCRYAGVEHRLCQEEREEKKLRPLVETGVNEVSVRSSSNPMPTGQRYPMPRISHLVP